MRKNSTIGIILIAAGALLAMKFLGLGHLINWAVSLIFPLILIGLGMMGWRNGNGQSVRSSPLSELSFCWASCMD